MSYYPEYEFKPGQEQKQTELLIDIKSKQNRQDLDLDDEGNSVSCVKIFFNSSSAKLFPGQEPTLNMTLRTKWNDAEITWIGTQPYV